MSEEIVYTIESGVAILRVNRPQARNALNWKAQEQFAEVVTAVSQDPNVRVLIITGTGDKAFVAGGDLKELSQYPNLDGAERLYRVMGDALLQLTQLPIPVMAAVNGDAFGGGCEILTACDLRLAGANVRFSFAQMRNALTTGWGGTGRLVRLIGQSRAMELLLTARLFDVQEAQQMGFVHRVVPEGENVLDTAVSWAKKLVALPQAALASTKALTQAASQLPLDQVREMETELFTQLWPQPDHLEAVAAFLGKRKAEFK